MFKLKIFLVCLISLIFFPVFVFAQEEKLTIATYYPSPYGVYQQLRLNPSSPPTDCTTASAPVGKMYFDSVANALFVCSRSGTTYGYQLVPGGNGAWGMSGNSLYVMNTTMNVGIGTTAPAAKLHVTGNIRGGNYASGAGDISAYSMEIGGASPTAANHNATLFLHDWNTIAHELRYKNGVLYLEATANGYGTSATPAMHIGGPLLAAVNGGNVGIGTAAPSAKLQLGSGTGSLHAGSEGFLIMPSTGDRAIMELHSPGNGNRLVMQSLVGASYIGSLDLKPLGLQTSGGRVGIGTDNPIADFDVRGNMANFLNQANTQGIGFEHEVGAPNYWEAIKYYRGGASYNIRLGWQKTIFSGQVVVGDSPTPTHTFEVIGTAYCSNGFPAASDLRWKDNIVPLPDPVEKLMRLRGVEFTWKRDEFKDMKFPEGKQIGMIAQEVEKEFPEFVIENEKGYKSLAYDKMTAVLLEAIKSQQREIEELKRQNSDLLTDVKILKDAAKLKNNK